MENNKQSKEYKPETELKVDGNSYSLETISNGLLGILPKFVVKIIRYLLDRKR